MKTWLRNLAESYRALWALSPHVKHLHRRLLTALLGLMLSTALEGVGIGLLVPLTALLFNPAERTLAPVVWLRVEFPGFSSRVYLALVAVGVALAIVGKNIVALRTAQMAARVQRDALTGLREKLFLRFSRAPMELFDRSPVGELAGVFTQEAQRAVDAISGAQGMVQSTLLALLYIAGILWLSAPLALGALVLGLLIGVLVAFVFRRMARSGAILTSSYATLSGRILEIFGGIRVVRTSNAQDFEVRRSSRR